VNDNAKFWMYLFLAAVAVVLAVWILRL